VLARSPRAVGAGVALVFVAMLGARFLVAAHRDSSRFVVAGSSFVDRSTVSPEIHVFEGSGYDGVFYWRLAIDPSARTLAARHGARIDQELRFGRVAYPTIAWLTAAGRPGLVTWSLVWVNVVAIGLAGWFAAGFAQARGHPPAYGALVALAPGLVTSAARDLCEVMMIAALVGGAWALARARPGWAASAWSVAALTHEQALIVVVGFALIRLVSVLRGRRRVGSLDLVWVAPLATFGLWQLISLAGWGRVPILSSSGKNLDAPLRGLVEVGRQVIHGDAPRQLAVMPVQLAVIVWLVVVALRTRPDLADDAWLRVTLVLAAVLAVCLSVNVWQAVGDLRQILIVPTLAWLAVLAGRKAPGRWITAASLATFAGTALLRVVAI
jgi:hypothetical protein